MPQTLMLQYVTLAFRLFQKETVVPAIRAALALHCQINRISTFDRKHYFYQDQPAGYQITQCYEPLASNGNVILFQHDGIAVQDGDSIQIGIKQVQLEQDTAKSIQQPPSVHLLDFNRVSHPLLEIISLPHIHHPETAAAFVRKVQSMLKSVDAAVLGMEMGGFRADVNVSVRRRGLAAQESDTTYHGVVGLGQRTEIKNLSSVKAVEDAIRAERDRQIRVLESGGVVEGETRGWTIGSTETTKLREKEGKVDYRYMPDPDIRPVIIDENLIRYLRNSLPDLPDRRLAELTSAPEHNLTMTDARTLLSLDDGQRLDYYENVRLAVQSALSNPYLNAGSRVGDVGRVTANWVLHELGSVMAMFGTSWEDNPVPEESMAGIITHLLARLITGKSAKQILYMVFSGDGRSVADIIDQDGLRLTTMSEAAYDELVAAVMEKHRDIVEQIQIKGKMGKIKFLVGQVMRQAKDGSVEAAKVEETLRRLLKIP
ncbi:MAG: hypothetical protein M1825_003495 [Sarcosagium campestre]|nr:MAG: hypothetical protein M1825_003495 [Sarcosagium campestre]